MNFVSINKKLAIKPLQKQGAKAETKNGFSYVAQNVTTVVSGLLFDADAGDGWTYLKGSQVAFLGKCEQSAWNKEVIRHGDVEFVLAPIEDVIFIKPMEAEEEAAKSPEDVK